MLKTTSRSGLKTVQQQKKDIMDREMDVDTLVKFRLSLNLATLLPSFTRRGNILTREKKSLM